MTIIPFEEVHYVGRTTIHTKAAGKRADAAPDA
jgi:hypothetical protein